MNPVERPYVDLKPSKGSVKGQRYVGLRGEKKDKLAELTVKGRARTTRWKRYFESSDIPGSEGPQALACSVGSD